MRLTALSAALVVSFGIRTPALSQSLPTFTWTGFYAGLNAGANFHGNDNTRRFFDLNQGYFVHHRKYGFSGGSQLGYSFQINGLVLGVETDIQSAFLRKSDGFFQSVFIPGAPGTPEIPGTPGTPAIPAIAGIPGTPGTPGTPARCTGPGGFVFPGITTAAQCAAISENTAVFTPATPATPGTPAVPGIPGTLGTPGTPGTPGTLGTPAVTTAYAQRFSATLSWFGTARGRFGIAPIPNLLLYLTGGFAYGEAQLRYGLMTTTATQGIGTTTTVFPILRSSKMLSGYTVGIGTEYALTEQCACTIKAEYLWVDLGKKTLSRGFSPAPGVLLPAARTDFATHVVRLGMNFYFSGFP